MSSVRYYSVAEEIFKKYPGYVRGVVLAYDVKNSPSPAELGAMLRQAEASVRERLNLDTLIEDPKIASWREAYRAFGAKPSEFRPSMEAMARRVLRNQELPLINALVDIGNILSLRHLVPTGGHAIDLLEQDLELRLASGQETFKPFDSEEIEHPLPGEVVFVEGNAVLTRRWTWRQSDRTLTLPTTTAIEYNVDGLPPVTQTEVETICSEVVELIQRFCGGRIRVEMLSAGNPRIRISE
ncbi:MAG: cytoplasmic protein [Anaerolineae bacterium]|nr:cytoplasmic protein [Anaerolineae bacterium]